MSRVSYSPVEPMLGVRGFNLILYSPSDDLRPCLCLSLTGPVAGRTSLRSRGALRHMVIMLTTYVRQPTVCELVAGAIRNLAVEGW